MKGKVARLMQRKRRPHFARRQWVRDLIAKRPLACGSSRFKATPLQVSDIASGNREVTDEKNELSTTDPSHADNG